jgi:hypothetical protein
MPIWKRAIIMVLVAAASGNVEAKGFHGGSGTGAGGAQPAEEFAGPFPSWVNVKTGCGAVGNGIANDTAAIQTCINGLNSTTPVVYFPAGTYNISSTLVWPGNGQTCSTAPSVGSSYGRLVGADPSTVTIKWVGASGATMFCLNGVQFSSINRMTLDANTSNSAKIIISQGWTGPNSGGQFADVGNEYTDVIFKNAGASTGAGFAFFCGTQGFQCSEVTLLRDQFINNVVGVQTEQANAADVWCWHCSFQGNGFAMSAGGTPKGIPGAPCGANDCAGQFSAFASVFQNTTNQEFTWGNNGPMFNLIDNYSSGANRFINSGGTGAFDPAVIKGNTIVNTANCLSILDADTGPELFIGNTVVTSGSCTTASSGGATSTPTAGPSIISSGDLLAKDNFFTKGSAPSGACSTTTPAFAGGRCHEFGETITTITPPPPPVLPGVPANLSRTIFEAAPSGSGTTCSAGSPCAVQTAVCLAATGSSGFSAGNCTGAVVPSRNVVHLIPGSYSISTTVSFPANTDIQFICDGYYAQLSPSGLSSGMSTVKINGPSSLVMHYCSVSGDLAKTVNGIEITGVDQVGAKVWADQLLMSNSNVRNVFADSTLSNVGIEIHDSHFFLSSDVAVSVAGGISLSIYGCVTTSSAPNGVFNISGPGSLMVNGCWNDAGADQIFSVSGSGRFALVGSHGGIGTDGVTLPPTAGTLSGFTGTAQIGSWDITPVSFAGTPAINVGTSVGATVLGWGIAGNSTYWNTGGAFSGTTGFLNSFQFQPGAGYGVTNYTEVSATQPFINNAMSLFETTSPTTPAVAAPGVTAIQLQRVFVSAGHYGIWIH